MGVGDATDPKQLTAVDLETLKKVWSNPLLVEDEFRGWMKSILEADPPSLPISQILGYQVAVQSIVNSAIAGAITQAPVTALPASPSNYQRIAFDTGQVGVYWDLMYDPVHSNWIYLGGPELTSYINTEESTTATSYSDLATVGPSVTVPLKGSYYAFWGMAGRQSTDGTHLPFAAVSVGGTLQDGIQVGAASDSRWFITRSSDVNVVSTNTVVKLVYLTNAGGTVSLFHSRHLRVVPKTVHL